MNFHPSPRPIHTRTHGLLPTGTPINQEGSRTPLDVTTYIRPDGGEPLYLEGTLIPPAPTVTTRHWN